MIGKPWVNVFVERSDGSFVDAKGHLNPDRPNALARVFDYWREKQRDSGLGLPPRGSIDPLDMVDVMPHLMMVDVQPEPLDFFYRVVGGHIVEQAGRSIQGNWLSELRDSEDPRDQALQSMLYFIGSAVMESHGPVWVDLEYQTIGSGMYKHVQAVCLPLSYDTPNAIEKILIGAVYQENKARLFPAARN